MPLTVTLKIYNKILQMSIALLTIKYFFVLNVLKFTKSSAIWKTSRLFLTQFAYQVKSFSWVVVARVMSTSELMVMPFLIEASFRVITQVT